jgi:rhomboid protease GluP
MLKILICPYFTQKSFSSAICIFNILIFIICLLYGSTPGKFLTPSQDTLILFGANSSTKLEEEHQVWRWITAVFLHADIKHITFNTLTFLMIGTRVEFGTGMKNTIIVYFISAIGGNILSSCMNNNGFSVGASTGICGVIGANIGWITLNWNHLSSNPNRNYTMICLVIWCILMLIIGQVESRIDNWGHFGGLVSGFAMGIYLFDPIGRPSQREKNLKLGCLMLVVVFIVGGAIGFYIDK